VLTSYEHGPQCTCDHDVERIMDDLFRQADQLPVGAVVERQLRRVTVRTILPR
jgi:hypothetical protein